MTLFDILSLVCGLALFLFGMALMSEALEKAAGSRMKNILASMTSTPLKGFLLGLGVTAVIQSSSATTVMVVGFVNSSIMTLRQAIGVIMGANVGTTVTAWLLTLTQVDGENIIVQLFKPDSFVPVLAAIGIILYMFQQNAKRKDIGMVMLGFAVLMSGMDTMSASVSGLSDVPEFASLFTMFQNPILGVLVGAAVTAIIQSSSASVGILQALSTTGSITIGACVPIIMGQNIGTCITALLSSVGTSKNARRTAIVHLCFNVVSTVILLTIYSIVTSIVDIPLISATASAFTISITHTAFNVLAVCMMMPCSRLLEKLACAIVRDVPGDKSKKDSMEYLDERLMTNPSVAIERCRSVTVTMAREAISAVKDSISMLSTGYDEEKITELRESENIVDKYEDNIGTYLVKLSGLNMSEADSTECNKLLHLIGDFERISDHSMNIVGSVEEMNEKKLSFSDEAKKEIATLVAAVNEILDITLESFENNDLDKATTVEPLEEVVDYLKEQLRKNHVKRLRKNECTIEMGFVQSDLLTNLERVSDHCSNIAACILEMSHDTMGLHKYLHRVKEGKGEEYSHYYQYYMMKYKV